jgi:hypothetical protein
MLGYLLAAAGPIAVAGANFLLSFSMLRFASAEVFGSFVFLFAAAAFMISLAAALFAAPMQALFADDQEIAHTVIRATTLVMLVALVIYLGLGLAFGLPVFTAASYGTFAMLTVLRTVGRAWCYTVEHPRRVTVSDTTYAIVTLATFVGTVALGGAEPARAVYPALACGAALAVCVFGKDFAGLVWRSRHARLSGYRRVWIGQSRWSLLAVSANEMAANAHIYLLTLFAGVATVAPVAAGALLLRPINVVQNALVEFERAQMARALAANAMARVARSIRLFRATLLLAWLGTVILAAVLLLFWPDIVIPEEYGLATVSLATALWAAVWLMISIQLPFNVLLQAADRFSILSRASVTAATISIAGVMLAILLGKPVWTVAALVPGWLVSTAMVAGAARRLLRQRGA